MRRDTRLSGALHALLHMCRRSEPVTAKDLADCLGTSPVLVHRFMTLLRDAAIVRSCRGHGGGWLIACDPESITVADIHVALGRPTLFAMSNRRQQALCRTEHVVNATLNAAYQAAEATLAEKFERITLADLMTGASGTIFVPRLTEAGYALGH